MPVDKIDKVIQKAKGKKAKTKPLENLPAKTKSQGLPSALKNKMEQTIGVDLSNVKVHYNASVAESCAKIKAQAYASGNNIYVANASNAKNAAFLAHEVAHFVQSGNGRMPSAKKGKVLVSK